MKQIISIVFIFTHFTYSEIVCAAEEIWLQDNNCIVVGSNNLEVKATPGSLMTFICSKDGAQITCSTTSKTDTMYGKKPSALTGYKVIIEDNEAALWKGTTYEAIFTFNLKTKRYSSTSMQILPEGLFNKNCVGEIKSY